MSEIIHPSSYRPYIIINTTQRCNLRCRMCFWSKPEIAQALRRDDQTMPMELYRHALDESVPYGRALCLAGSGEFLADPMREERLQILGETLRTHQEIMLYQTTNGTLFSAENLEFLRGVKKVGFTFSIDSVDALTYASIRKPGGLAEVQTTIRSLRKQLQELGVEEIHIRLNMVIMKRNIFSLPDVLRFAREVNAVVFVDHPQGFGPDDLHRESLFGYPAFANAFLRNCQALAEMLNVEFQRPPAFAIHPDEIEEYRNSFKSRKLSCYQLDREGPVQVSPNGDVSVCCQNLVFGNLNQQSFKEIFFSPRYTEYREAIARGTPLPPCDQCRHLYRGAPYLYESSVYGMDIPPESRNLDPEPDFESEGFFDWMDELSERQLRHHLRHDYQARARRLAGPGIMEELASFERTKRMNGTILDWIQEKSNIVIYPAGKQTAWMLKHTLLAKANILAISDRNPGMHGKPFHGHPVIAPQDIAALKPDILLVASDLHHAGILRELRQLEEAGIELVTL